MLRKDPEKLTNQVDLQSGLHKVGIRGIQIRANFTILGAKIEGPVYYWISELEIMELRLTFDIPEPDSATCLAPRYRWEFYFKSSWSL